MNVNPRPNFTNDALAAVPIVQVGVPVQIVYAVQPQANQPSRSVNIDELVKEANGSFYDKETEKHLDDKIEEMRILAGLNKSFPPEKENIPSARYSLQKLAGISSVHYPQQKMRALDLIIFSCESDPVTKATSHGIIQLAMDLMKDMKRDLMQTENIDIQKKVAQAYGKTIALILRHYASEHLNAVTKELKTELNNTSKELLNLNTQNDIELQYYVEYAKEAIHRLAKDEKLYMEAMRRVFSLVSAIRAVKDKDFEQFFVNLLKAIENIDENFKSSWFDSLFTVEQIAKSAIHSSDQVIAILRLMKQKQKGDWKFTYGALENLGFIIRESNEQLCFLLALDGTTAINGFFMQHGVHYNGLRFFLVESQYDKDKSDNLNERDQNIRLGAYQILIKLLDHPDKEKSSTIKSYLHESYNEKSNKIRNLLRSISNEDRTNTEKKVNEQQKKIEREPITRPNKFKTGELKNGKWVEKKSNDEKAEKPEKAIDFKVFKKCIRAQKMTEIEKDFNELDGLQLYQKGLAFENRKGVEDGVKAVEYFNIAAEKGNIQAMLNLASRYRHGKDVIKDEKKGLYYYKMAADLGDTDAMVNAGICYANGQGVEENNKEANDIKAAEYYNKAARLHNIRGAYEMGKCFELGIGTLKNESKAAQCYQVASNKNFAPAMIKLARLYKEGFGVEKDEGKAKQLLESAKKIESQQK